MLRDRRYFSGNLRSPLEVLPVMDEQETAVGFIKLSSRSYAEDCISDHVAFIEGWYVDAPARLSSIGSALVRAAEAWARAQGCSELRL